jgi:hypothetical protein
MCKLATNDDTYATHISKEIFRRLYVSIQVKGHWCLKWNGKIHSLYKDLNIIDVIEIRRLGWVGHIIKMEEKESQKRFLVGNTVT